MTASQIELLRRLQEIDGEIYDLEALGDALPQEVAKHRGIIAVMEKQLDEHKDIIKKDQVQSHTKEGELSERESDIAKFKVQLNTATTNKEYSALLHEIEIKKMELHKLEDAILEIMSESENLHVQQRRLEAELDQERSNLSDSERRATEEGRSIEAKLSELTAKRSLIAAEVPPPTLAKYNRVLRRHRGGAMAAVEEEACQGCHMTVTHQEINMLKGHDRLVFCRSCNRILYLPDGEA